MSYVNSHCSIDSKSPFSEKIAESDLKLVMVIGRGSFGEVYKVLLCYHVVLSFVVWWCVVLGCVVFRVVHVCSVFACSLW